MLQNPNFRPIYRPCFTPPTVPLRAPHWYELSDQDISRSAPAKKNGDFVIHVPPKDQGATGPIETAEDAVSLTDVLLESRRLRRWEEAVEMKKRKNTDKELAVCFNAARDEEDEEVAASVSIIDPSVKPKGKNPFDYDN